VTFKVAVYFERAEFSKTDFPKDYKSADRSKNGNFAGPEFNILTADPE
jgi:hypothetical protein